MTDQEKWADKIAALLRKAESTTEPQEAEVFFAKAQELMAKYAIDEALLRAAGKDTTNDPIVMEEFVTVGIYRHALYMLDHYVALNNGCKTIEITGSPWRSVDGKMFKETRVLKIVGCKSDIDRTRMLATSLKLQCMRAEATWWKENSRLYSNFKKSEQHQARRGFMLAFGTGANTKMAQATARGRQAAEAEHGANSVALVLRDKSLKVQDKYDEMFPDRRSKTSRLAAGDAYARNEGYAAGQRADVGQEGLRGTKQISR